MLFDKLINYIEEFFIHYQKCTRLVFFKGQIRSNLLIEEKSYFSMNIKFFLLIFNFKRYIKRTLLIYFHFKKIRIELMNKNYNLRIRKF